MISLNNLVGTDFLKPIQGTTRVVFFGREILRNHMPSYGEWAKSGNWCVLIHWVYGFQYNNFYKAHVRWSAQVPARHRPVKGLPLRDEMGSFNPPSTPDSLWNWTCSISFLPAVRSFDSLSCLLYMIAHSPREWTGHHLETGYRTSWLQFDSHAAPEGALPLVLCGYGEFCNRENGETT